MLLIIFCWKASRFCRSYASDDGRKKKGHTDPNFCLEVVRPLLIQFKLRADIVLIRSGIDFNQFLGMIYIIINIYAETRNKKRGKRYTM